jgi:hypothetical protein
MEATRIGTARDLPPVSTLAKWVVSAAKDQPYKHLFLYPDLATLLQVDPQGRRGRSAILRAQRTLLDEYNKYLACVVGKGYEIANPSEHADHVQRIRKASLRKLRKAHRVSVHVDIAGLTAEELKSLTMQQTKTGAMLSWSLRIESKRKLATVQKEMQAMTPRSIAKALTAKAS